LNNGGILPRGNTGAGLRNKPSTRTATSQGHPNCKHFHKEDGQVCGRTKAKEEPLLLTFHLTILT